MTVKWRVLFLSAIIFSSYFFSGKIIYAQSAANNPATGAGQKANSSITPGKKSSNRQDTVKRVTELSGKMLSRSNDALLRLDNIWLRVKSRIDKFSASGKDVSGLAGWIQQVEIKRKAAADVSATASADMAKIDASVSAKTAVKTFLNAYKEVKKALKAYQQAILTVITNLKGMSAQTGSGPTVIPTATKTPTITGSVSPTATVIPATATINPT